MPIVPPMVSAATGAALIAQLPAASDRLTLLLLWYSMFGLSLFMAMIVIVLIWARLAHHGLPSAQAVPTLWIVLGPLGQPITAAALFGNAASGFAAPPYGSALHAFAIVYGVPTWASRPGVSRSRGWRSQRRSRSAPHVGIYRSRWRGGASPSQSAPS